MRIRLQSDQMVFAPGVIAYAQALWAEGRKDTALAIVNAWPGLPVGAAERIARGDAATEVDAEDALIVSLEGD